MNQTANDLIGSRAYQLWENAGKPEGTEAAMNFWNQAELEVVPRSWFAQSGKCEEHCFGTVEEAIFNVIFQSEHLGLALGETIALNCFKGIDHLSFAPEPESVVKYEFNTLEWLEKWEQSGGSDKQYVLKILKDLFCRDGETRHCCSDKYRIKSIELPGFGKLKINFLNGNVVELK